MTTSPCRRDPFTRWPCSFAIDGSGPFGPAGHAMSGYVSLPGAWRNDANLAASWVEKARDHVGSLPSKIKKPKSARPKQ